MSVVTNLFNLAIRLESYSISEAQCPNLHNEVLLQIVLWDTIIEKKEDAKIQQQFLTVPKPIRSAERDGPFQYPFQVSYLSMLFCLNQVPLVRHAY